MRLFRRKKVLVCSSCATVHDEEDYKAAVAELFLATFNFGMTHVYHGLEEVDLKFPEDRKDIKLLERTFGIYQAKKYLDEARSNT